MQVHLVIPEEQRKQPRLRPGLRQGCRFFFFFIPQRGGHVSLWEQTQQAEGSMLRQAGHAYSADHALSKQGAVTHPEHL
eukprot:3934802-Rhodomonas_salina.1